MTEEEREYPKGKISHQATVWCGRCSAWEYVGNYGSPAQDARDAGWKMTMADGWICPACLKEAKAND